MTPVPNRLLWQTLLRASRILLCRGMVADSIGADEETGAVSPTRALEIAAKLVSPEDHAKLWRQAIVQVAIVAGNDRWGEESDAPAVLNLFAVVGDEALAGTDGDPAVLWSEHNALLGAIFRHRDDEALISSGLRGVQMLYIRARLAAGDPTYLVAGSLGLDPEGELFQELRARARQRKPLLPAAGPKT